MPDMQATIADLVYTRCDEGRLAVAVQALSARHIELTGRAMFVADLVASLEAHLSCSDSDDPAIDTELMHLSLLEDWAMAYHHRPR